MWVNHNKKLFLTTPPHNINESVKKITDHPGFEPGTLALLVPCFTDWANESDGKEQSMFPSIGLHQLEIYATLTHHCPYFVPNVFQIYPKIAKKKKHLSFDFRTEHWRKLNSYQQLATIHSIVCLFDWFCFVFNHSLLRYFKLILPLSKKKSNLDIR